MSEQADIVRAVFADLQGERFAALRERFAPSLATRLSEAALASTWRNLSRKVGAVREIGAPSTVAGMAVLPLVFEAAALELAIQAGDDGLLTTLLIRPPSSLVRTWTPPGYDDPHEYESLEVGVGTTPPLPGILRVPRRRRPVPAAVILHGSGPGDADGTVNTVKPYRDLAIGLASAGVAALTFDKRTAVAPDLFPADATVEHEVLADARAAVALLACRPEIDPGRIVVVGHSLGAMLAPRLVAEGAPVAALALLCAPTRRLEEVALEQIRFQAAQPDGPTEEASRAALGLQPAALAALDSLRRGEPVGDMLPMGLPASYWLDLDATDPVSTALALRIPVHVIHGGRDAQVSGVDLARWQTAAATARHLTVSVHKRCNHLLVEAKGAARIESYDDGGHVSKAVVKELAAMIRKAPELST